MSHVGEPLAGCVMVITADRRKRELAAALERRGADVRFAPALSTVSHLDDAQLIEDTRAIIAEPPDVVVATTGIGFRGWIEAADAAGIAEPLLDVLRDARLVARGPKARGAIQQNGLEADWVAESETAAELRDFLLAEGVKGLRIAVQHHGNGSDGLDEAFTTAGATVQSLVIYGWGPPVDPEPHREWIDRTAAGEVDAVLFTSAPGAQEWVDGVRSAGVLDAVRQRAAGAGLVLASVGPVTAGPLVDAGLQTCYPDRWRLGALVRELVKDFSENTTSIPTPDGPLVMRAGAAVLDGRVLSLTPTGLEILRALAKAGGNVLTREQLGELLPGAQAGPHAVEAAINRLRENSGSRTLVRTVVKRGYALAVTAA
ncbi:uroporphyrinogen-III synthase [uncultured Demequina sp.]|uniref:uroporphyrinogen-III synthase n=1 Tax=uncultured Demequina sp. TaxID=693499 RepID=UPI0025FFB2E3|nr:uroporphyrinogen-III synthase [uncultured Demequina sp.]